MGYKHLTPNIKNLNGYRFFRFFYPDTNWIQILSTNNIFKSLYFKKIYLSLIYIYTKLFKLF